MFCFDLNWIELNWIGLNWIDLNWIDLNWIDWSSHSDSWCPKFSYQKRVDEVYPQTSLRFYPHLNRIILSKNDVEMMWLEFSSFTLFIRQGAGLLKFSRPIGSNDIILLIERYPSQHAPIISSLLIKMFLNAQVIEKSGGFSDSPMLDKVLGYLSSADLSEITILFY